MTRRAPPNPGAGSASTVASPLSKPWLWPRTGRRATSPTSSSDRRFRSRGGLVADRGTTAIGEIMSRTIRQQLVCPKGAATRGYVTSPLREYRVKYRRPYGAQWEELSLERAMDMIADRVIETRRQTWQEKDGEGRVLNRTLGIASLGGATLDNEE